MTEPRAATADAPARPRLAVFKFASCDGCQLSLLDCEDELLAVAANVEIASFLEASSDVQPGPYDVALVEGSITTEGDRARLLRIRAEAKVLVAIGACATAGGIQSLRNRADVNQYLDTVYPGTTHLEVLSTSTRIADHVPVDVELHGCPIDRHQLLAVLGALLAGRRAPVAATSVCLECKQSGVACLIVTAGTPCLGPITRGGCGALCPKVDRGCYGCFGPADTLRVPSLMRTLAATGLDPQAQRRLLQTFNAADPALDAAAQAIGAGKGATR